MRKDMELLEDLVDGDWEDDEDMEEDMSGSGVWQASQFLSWFGDVTNGPAKSLDDFEPLTQRFLIDQCLSLRRVCDELALAGYVGTLRVGEEADVVAYLSYLNDPGRYTAKNFALDD